MAQAYTPEQIIFHIDVNSAYLSWTAVRELERGNPVDLRKVPAIVAGDEKSRHGIVLAKSIPAKAFGIQTAEPLAQALRKCPDLVVVPPDHSYYRERSRQLMEYLSMFSPDIEQVSVDECYMDFTSIRKKYTSPLEAANLIREGVLRSFGYTVNVGVSDRKVLAKMASDFRKPNLVHTLYSWEIEEKMWPLPISELFMCGRSSAGRFHSFGIRTIGDLARMDLSNVELNFKSHGRLLWNYANGIDDTPVVLEQTKAKGIGNSTTLAEDVADRAQAHRILRELADSVGRRLRSGHFLAGVVCTEIKYASFVSVSHQCPFSAPTATTEDIYLAACRLFDELWDGSAIRLLGIRTTKLADEGEPVQLSIFDLPMSGLQTKEPADLSADLSGARQAKKRRQLDDAVDAIRKRFGADAVHRGM